MQACPALFISFRIWQCRRSATAGCSEFQKRKVTQAVNSALFSMEAWRTLLLEAAHPFLEIRGGKQPGLRCAELRRCCGRAFSLRHAGILDGRRQR
jgi:hypothetical protein